MTMLKQISIAIIVILLIAIMGLVVFVIRVDNTKIIHPAATAKEYEIQKQEEIEYQKTDKYKRRQEIYKKQK